MRYKNKGGTDYKLINFDMKGRAKDLDNFDNLHFDKENGGRINQNGLERTITILLTNYPFWIVKCEI